MRTLQIDLVLWLSEFVTEWKSRPDSGKESDRSDLIIKFRKKFLRKYKVTKRQGD